MAIYVRDLEPQMRSNDRFPHCSLKKAIVWLKEAAPEANVAERTLRKTIPSPY
jgi:hypothetical protein